VNHRNSEYQQQTDTNMVTKDVVLFIVILHYRLDNLREKS